MSAGRVRGAVKAEKSVRQFRQSPIVHMERVATASIHRSDEREITPVIPTGVKSERTTHPLAAVIDIDEGDGHLGGLRNVIKATLPMLAEAARPFWSEDEHHAAGTAHAGAQLEHDIMGATAVDGDGADGAEESADGWAEDGVFDGGVRAASGVEGDRQEVSEIPIAGMRGADGDEAGDIRDASFQAPTTGPPEQPQGPTEEPREKTTEHEGD